MRIQTFDAMQKNISTHDPLPDPEPSVPSLPDPDPGVFHHELGQPNPATDREIDPA
jgi:hypothetical protein